MRINVLPETERLATLHEIDGQEMFELGSCVKNAAGKWEFIVSPQFEGTFDAKGLWALCTLMQALDNNESIGRGEWYYPPIRKNLSKF